MAQRKDLTPYGREKALVEICFSVLMLTTDPTYGKTFSKMTNEQKAEWLRDQLAAQGFETSPCGSNWGLLKEL